MTRYLFGLDPADYVEDSARRPVANATATFWDALTAGNQYTDLQLLDGTPVTQLVTNTRGEWGVFRGPDGVVMLYVSANGGPRRLLFSVEGLVALVMAVSAGGSGGTSAVTKVAGRTGDVVLSLDDVSDTTGYKRMTSAERTKLANLDASIGSGATGTTVVRGTGVDLTGNTVSRSAVQAIIDAADPNTEIRFPDNGYLNFDGTITVSKPLHFTGHALLKFTAGIANAPAFKVTSGGAGSTFNNLRISNPNELGAQTGVKSAGIEIHADEITVHRCLIDRFQNGIVVSPDGEWSNFIFTGNRIKDVIGAGDGPSNTTSNKGEDRGDGIVSWGAQATIVGNIVNAKAGTDARIGIHCEGLKESETFQAAHSDAMATITGNVVYGQFRRSIALENVANSTVTGNTVADATWYALNVIGNAQGSVVSNNAILWTRATSDNQGAAFSPRRVPIMLYGGVSNVKVVNNPIRIAAGAVAQGGIVATGFSDAERPTRCTIQGNELSCAPGYTPSGGSAVPAGQVTGSGVLLDFNSYGMKVDGNHMFGLGENGCYGYGAHAAKITNNEFQGSGSDRKGVMVEATDDGVQIDGNSLTGFGTGILRGGGSLNRFVNNTIENADVGIDAYGVTNSVEGGNLFRNVTNPKVNMSGVAHLDNNGVATGLPTLPSGVYYTETFPFTDPAVARPTTDANVVLIWRGPAFPNGNAPTNLGVNDEWNMVVS